VLEVEVLAEGLAHAEGPDVLPDGRIVFVETFRGQLSAWGEHSGVELYAYVGGGPNACIVGLDGVYVTQNGGVMGEWRSPDPTAAAIQRVGWDGRIDTIATTAGGDPLEGPNDLAFGPDGRLYFTDPGNWDTDNPSPGRLCALGAAGDAEVLADVGPTYPNGLVALADGSIVWGESYTRAIRRRGGDGAITELTVLPEGHIPDGMKLGADGNLYIASVTSGGIDVVALAGGERSFLHTGGEPQNCIFAGTDLYVADFGEVPQYGQDGLAASPDCGRLIRLAIGVEGVPPYRFAL
jgi:gluconolactonase